MMDFDIITLTETVQAPPLEWTPDNEVMRLTKDRVIVNPNIQLDDAARHVINALEHHIQQVVRDAIKEERQRLIDMLRA